MAARAQGSATISFGLVAIPVKLYTTAQGSSAIRFNLMAKDGSRLKQQYVSAKTGEVVERQDMVKGYEFAKGQFVTFEPEELKALEAKGNQAIDIDAFVPLAKVDRMLAQKSYYLGPDKGGAKPYHLLAAALRDAERVAIARYAARGKDYLVIVRPIEGGLIMDQLYYADELKSFAEVPMDHAEVSEAELGLARQLIDQAASDHFDHERYTDRVRAQILALIERKVAGEDVVIEADDQAEHRIVDLMAALKASLKDDGEARPARRVEKKKKTAAKRKTTRKTASRS